MQVRSTGHVTPTGDQQVVDALEHFWPAVLGELAAPLAHEFNNFLNNVLLEVAVLDAKVPESIRPELAAIRRQATRVAGAVHRLQDYMQVRDTALEPVALDTLIRTVAGAWERAGSHSAPPSLQLHLAPDLPPVPVPAGDFQRLLFLMLQNGTRRCLNGGQAVDIRTQLQGESVRITVEIRAETGATDQGAEISLETAACKAIASRIGGKLHFAHASGGVCITLELAAGGGSR